jgi:sugar lactone lactonase YvrE
MSDPRQQVTISKGIHSMKTELVSVAIATFALCWLLAGQGTSRGDTLYASSIAGYIDKIDSSGNGTLFSNSGLLGYPTGLAFDSATNLYAANANGNYIVKFDSSGVGTIFASPGFGFTAMAFDGAGNLYAANHSTSVIWKFNSSGVGVVFANVSLNDPMGLAFDKSGNLYAANRGNSTIEKFNSSGVGTLFANTGLNHPAGLAFDSAGNLYVANQGAGTIVKFNSSGVGTTFSTAASPAFGLAFPPVPSPITCPNITGTWTGQVNVVDSFRGYHATTVSLHVTDQNTNGCLLRGYLNTGNAYSQIPWGWSNAGGL